MNITSKQIIRNINLYLLSDIPLEEPYLSIFSDLDNIFKSLKVFKPRRTYWKDYNFYGENKVLIYFSYNHVKNSAYIDYDSFYIPFLRKHKLPYTRELLDLIVYFINKYMNLNIKNVDYKPLSNNGNHMYELEHLDI